MRGAAPALVSLLLSMSCSAATLDEVCESLPASAQVRVSYTPSAAQIDDSKPARDIRLDTEKAGAYRQLGVTRATLLRNVDVRLEGYSDERTGRACGWPKVTLSLSVHPLLIELARELASSECLRAHVLAHEMQHIAIYNAAVLRSAQQLELEMRSRFSERQLDGDSATLMRELQEEISQRWVVRLDALLARAEREHEALDAAEEQQAQSVCNGALAALINLIQ